MDSTQWDRLKQLFAAALELPAERRVLWAHEQCGDDAALERELLQLLEAHESTTGLKLSTSDSQLSGRILDDFVLGEELGRGGMGTVLRARQLSLERDVAVKVLSAQVASSPGRIERFRAEARRIGRLQHPGIVAVHLFGVCDDCAYIAMELVEGRDLQRELERVLSREAHDNPILPRFGGPAYYISVTRILTEVACALQAAHDEGVVHRDIKPQNILLTRQGRAKVVDFGVAFDARMGSLEANRERGGTPHYMSPEQVEAERCPVDHRTDVYSMGVVLFQLLTGRVPFDGETSSEVFDRIRRFEPTSARRVNPRAPRELVDVCAKAMARLPADRYASAGSLADDLQRYLDGVPVLAPSTNLLRTAWALARRRRRGLTLLAVVLLGSLAWRFAAAARQHQRELDRAADRRATQSLDLEFEFDDGLPTTCAVTISRFHPAFERGLMEVSHETVTPRAERGRLVLPSILAGELRIHIDAGPRGRAELRRMLRAQSHPRVFSVRLRPDSEVCDGMVRLNGGTVSLLYSIANSDGVLEHFRPCETVEPLWVDRYPVTNAQYEAFADATGAAKPKTWISGLPEAWRDRPVTMVTFEQAQACAEWYGKRLPTRAELEWIRLAPGCPWPLTEDGSEIAFATPSPIVAVRPMNVGNEADAWAELHNWSFALLPDVTDFRPGRFGIASTFGVLALWADGPVLKRRGRELDFEESCRVQLGLTCEDAFTSGILRLGMDPKFEPAVNWSSPALGFRCVRTAHD